jgi:nucleotide-binding universal stress UspA family protein
VHAWWEIFVTGHFAAPAVYEFEAVEAVARETLDKAIASIPSGSPELDVEPVLVHGDAAVELMAHAQDASMIVIGSRGRGGVTEMLLGSVSREIVHRASRPVVIIR